MKKSRTVLEQERLFKKQQGEGQELLDEMTQPDEAKAADIIISKNKEAEKSAKEDEDRKVEELEKSLKWTHKEYVAKLGNTLYLLAQNMDVPPGYYYRVNFNDTKINLMIHHVSGKKFGRGIKPCGNPEIDFHAIGVLVTQAENTIDYMEERGAFRKDGLIVPKTGIIK
jgi:hypothetical protein